MKLQQILAALALSAGRRKFGVAALCLGPG